MTASATTETAAQKVHRLLFTEPLENTLRRHGIDFTINRKGWYQLSRCPLCSSDPAHARHRRPSERECGVTEKPATRGKGTLKAVKCFHTGNEDTFLDWLKAAGDITSSDVYEYHQAKANGTLYKGSASSQDNAHIERNKRAADLWADTPAAKAAREWLLGPKRLYTQATVKNFHFGLINIRRKNDDDVENALCLPIPGKTGPKNAPVIHADRNRPDAKARGQYMFLTVPGLTKNAPAKDWRYGEVLTFWATAVHDEREKELVVCDGAKDAIILAQKLEEGGYIDRFTIISGTSGVTNFPEEWKSADFWRPWRAVYAAQDIDIPKENTPPDRQQTVHEGAAVRIYQTAERNVRRVRVPRTFNNKECKDWTDFFAAGATPQDAIRLFDKAQEIREELKYAADAKAPSTEPPRLDGDRPVVGTYADSTADVAYSYVGGYYYYPFSVLEFGANHEGVQTVDRVTKVLRSDGSIWQWYKIPSSGGGSDVLALRDGTLLSRIPQVSPQATWQLDGILNFAKASKTGRAKNRPLAAILKECLELLQDCVWLPYPEDYYTLLLTIPVTYVQEMFDAVPYLLLTGPKASGKSETASIISALCANSTMVGAGSHAFAAAQINAARGLMVLDDKENLAANDVDASMLEILKIGYKRITGLRGLIDKERRLTYQHVYGVKLITCISGVEDVVGTRMLHVHTAPYSPTRAGRQIRRFTAEDRGKADRLRQELHAWTFAHIDAIKAEYRKLIISGITSSRSGEIQSPLRVFAALTDDPSIVDGLEKALAMQNRQVSAAELTPENLLQEVVDDMIRQGYNTISITHLRNEMTLVMDPNEGKSWTNEIAKWQREAWLAKQLKAQHLVRPDEKVQRKRIAGRIEQRLWRLNNERIKAVVEQMVAPPPSLHALDFCAGCQNCKYANRCPIMQERLSSN